MRSFVLSIALLLSSSIVATAQDRGSEPAWTRYVDPIYDFSVDLPLGLFEPTTGDDSQGMTLVETGGDGQLNIYGGAADGMTLDQFAETLASGEQIRTITYRTRGTSWFVLSGHFAPSAAAAGPLIFYTKVLLSPDGNRFSAFEISYPEADKARYDAIVDHIESTMTRPGGAT